MGRKDERPRLSHLRDSGAIEQDADVVMFIHRRDANMGTKEVVNEESHTGEDIQDMTDLIVAKQRNGPTGDVELHFHKKFSRFFSPADHNAMKYTEEFGGHAETA
jgi:replicative DNA helicase